MYSVKVYEYIMQTRAVSLYLLFCLAKNNIIPVNCTDGEIRLVGGSTKYEGRVEVCINRGFGTVCGLNFDSNEANIVCRQIGAIPNGI